jgi:alpha-beta hydrolase superfamily lysophospholipase
MIAFRDELYDGQFLRALGHSAYGAASVGECFAAARAIRERDHATWLRAWMDLATRTMRSAEESASRGHDKSAETAFLRASNYARTAYIFHFESPLSRDARDAYRLHREAFARFAALRALEPLAIPFEDQTMHGCFFKADDTRRPLVISIGGYDSTAEESYLWNAVAANTRGYHALVFDGPGQGAMLFDHGVAFRPDWERALSAVIDAIEKRDDVDASRIVLIGESFGGFLAPRCAARDPRVAACVVDPAQMSLFRAALARVPLPTSWKRDLPRGPRWLVAMVRVLLARVAKKPTAGFALRRGMLTHGAATPWDYFADTARYDATSDIAKIRCPMLVCDAANDDVSAFARRFYEALTCEKSYMRFTEEDGAADHCVMGNRLLFHERAFDWLDELLAQKSRATSGRPILSCVRLTASGW